MSVTRTINQIHFEDLDPIRFEELILSVVYRMARWDTISHPGKKGSDDGIDIEAIEVLENGKERSYHFQCKRYSKLNTTQLKGIIDNYFKKNDEIPDKYILVTACNLSKKNMDAFRLYAKSKGFQSVDIWTKTVLEARLYAEHHDLLFAYFGINLSKQRNDAIASLRRNISLKHKMHNDFIKPLKDMPDRETRLRCPWERFISSEVIIRSIDDTSYPENELLIQGHYGYHKAEIYDFYYNGLVVFAFPYVRNIVVKAYRLYAKNDDGSEGEYEAKNITATIFGYIPYNNIIDYDLDGDEFYMMPHLFCDFSNGESPFEFIKYAVKGERGYSMIDDDLIIEIK